MYRGARGCAVPLRCFGKRAGLWVELKEAALDICENYERIVFEVRRLEPGFTGTSLSDYARAYKVREDLTIQFLEPEGGEPSIYQAASGGGFGRDIKEACRRAFARLIIHEMHKKRIEVNLTVA